MGYLIGIALLVAGLVAGAYFPDLDQRLPLLHRSILTHNAFLPLLLGLLFRRQKAPALRLLTVGLSMGLAVHLAFDLFPQAWTGFARISLPFFGWTSPTFSWLWIALSIALCLVVVAALVRSGLEAGLAAAGLVGAFAWYAPSQHVYIWGELLALVVAAALAVAVRSAYRRRRTRRW
jgi:hypothetical protein